MVNIDYPGVIADLKKKFKRNPEDDRKIIFWYDPPAQFKEDVESDSFDFCRLLVVNGNEFAVKKTIEHDDLTSDFLVYSPTEKPQDNENWLLDILMYSEEYFADTIAYTMRRLGLTNTDLRRVIEHHTKFFDADGRTKKLGSYIVVDDNMSNEDFMMAMMCVLTKANARSIESILAELVFDDAAHTKYAELVKYGFEDLLWDEVCKYYNYEGDLKIETLTKKFLFTALLEQKAELEDLPSFYDQYTIQNTGRMDAKFFVDKIKTDKRYPALQLSVGTDLGIEGILAPRDIMCVQSADVFECIETHIIKKIADSLRNGSLDYDAFERVIATRNNSLWYAAHKAEYEMMQAAISFFRMLEKPIAKDLLATEYIRNYTEGYYLADTYYRRACVAYKQIENPIFELEALIDRVELHYQDRFLQEIGREFSKSLESVQSWQFPGFPSTREFFRKVQANNYKKCFVIISDGFRYEIGRELYERIKVDTVLKGTEEIKCAIAPLPSETRFGMASLLPHQALAYQDKAVLADGKPTNSIAARDAILKDKNPSCAAISYDDINNMQRADLRTYMADKSIVYVYHNVVDNAGEHNESRVFDVVETAVNEILMLIRKLYNSLQISNFYVTADHGFLYRKNEIHESQKYSNVVAQRPIEASKRFVIAKDDVHIPFTTEFPLNAETEEPVRVILPYGYDLFKTQGSGQQYVHGGAALQEIIVPVIRIGELSAAKNKDAVTPVGVRLKSITRKITNRSFTLEFEQYEKVGDYKQATNCETYMIDESGEKVTGEYRFLANSDKDDAESRSFKIRFALRNIDFDRNKRYYLILRNLAKPDEYIEKEQFTIDILQFKVF